MMYAAVAKQKKKTTYNKYNNIKTQRQPMTVYIGISICDVKHGRV